MLSHWATHVSIYKVRACQSFRFRENYIVFSAIFEHINDGALPTFSLVDMISVDLPTLAALEYFPGFFINVTM